MVLSWRMISEGLHVHYSDGIRDVNSISILHDSVMTVDKHGWIRWVANGIQLVGYFLLIHDTMGVGLLIKGLSDLLIMYWGLSNKLWDVFIVTGIFCVMNFERLYELMMAHHWLLSVQQSVHQLM